MIGAIGIILVLASVILFTAKGVQDGGLVTAVYLLFLILSMGISSGMNTSVATFLSDQIHLEHYVQDNVYQFVNSNYTIKSDEELADAQKNVIKKMNLPSAWQKKLIKNNTEEGYKMLSVSDFPEYVAAAVGNLEVRNLAYVVILIILMTIFLIISHTFDIPSMLPEMDQINKLAGSFVGLIMGIMAIYLILAILSFFLNYHTGNGALEAVVHMPIVGFLYRHNYLLGRFSLFF